jgi:cytochrome c556
MSRSHVAGFVFTLALAGTTGAFADDAAPAQGPGWTGLTKPQEVIDARAALMIEIERLMKPIDLLTTGERTPPDELRSAASTIAKMLLVVPHLFPPTTNLYDAKAETPATIAMPAIWTSFPAFEQMAKASAAAAEAMAATQDPNGLEAAGLKLRATCDACHAPYLRTYVAEGVSSDDVNFDFDSVLPKN